MGDTEKTVEELTKELNDSLEAQKKLASDVEVAKKSQSGVDISLAEMRKENEILKKSIEDGKKSSLTKSETDQLELEEMKKTIQEEKDLRIRAENKIMAQSIMSEKGLDDKNDLLLLLTCETEEAMIQMADDRKSYLDNKVAEIKQKIADGDDPKKGIKTAEGSIETMTDAELGILAAEKPDMVESISAEITKRQRAKYQ